MAKPLPKTGILCGEIWPFLLDCLQAVLDHFSIGDVSNDVAVLSSYDPVSLDQACVDLVNMSEECQILALHIASCNGLSTLIQAEQMGLGSRTYAFLSIDN